MDKLTLKNYFFWSDIQLGQENISLCIWISKRLLHGKESRARSRFLEMITPRVNELDAERKRIMNEYAQKDKDKKTLYIDKEGKETLDLSAATNYKFENQNKTLEAMKEFTDYLNEDYVIDITPSNKETIQIVTNIILNTDDEFSGDMAVRYNEWCKAFEKLRI